MVNLDSCIERCYKGELLTESEVEEVCNRLKEQCMLLLSRHRCGSQFFDIAVFLWLHTFQVGDVIVFASAAWMWTKSCFLPHHFCSDILSP